MMQPHHNGQQTIRGIILPTEWDDNDNVRAVTLSGVDEEDYVVENWEHSVGLRQVLIDATGHVQKEPDTQWRIRINHYDVIDIFRK